MDLFWMTTSPSGGMSAASAAAYRGEQKAQGAADAVRRLESRVNQLALINMALWSLLQEKTGLTDEDLMRRVEEIDLTDGRLDGRVAEHVAECPQCQRTLSLKHDICLYCGFAPGDANAFGIRAPR